MSGTALGSPAFYEGSGQGAADQTSPSPFAMGGTYMGESFQAPSQSFTMPGSTFDPNQQLWQRPPDVDPSRVLEWAQVHYEHFPQGSPSFPRGVGPGYNWSQDLSKIAAGSKAESDFEAGTISWDEYRRKLLTANESVQNINVFYGENQAYWAPYYQAAYPGWLPAQQTPFKIKERPRPQYEAGGGEGGYGGDAGGEGTGLGAGEAGSGMGGGGAGDVGVA